MIGDQYIEPDEIVVNECFDDVQCEKCKSTDIVHLRRNPKVKKMTMDEKAKALTSTYTAKALVLRLPPRQRLLCRMCGHSVLLPSGNDATWPSQYMRFDHGNPEGEI